MKCAHGVSLREPCLACANEVIRPPTESDMDDIKAAAWDAEVKLRRQIADLKSKLDVASQDYATLLQRWKDEQAARLAAESRLEALQKKHDAVCEEHSDEVDRHAAAMAERRALQSRLTTLSNAAQDMLLSMRQGFARGDHEITDKLEDAINGSLVERQEPK